MTVIATMTDMMRMKRILAAVMLMLLCAVAAAQSDYVHVAKAKGKFTEVKESLVQAIEDRGLVVNNIAHVGVMLDRTGIDLESHRQIYQDAEVIEFCSAKISRAVMEADPQSIVLCPYGISIYTLQGQTDTVYVAYRRFPSDPGVKAAADLVAAIVEDALR